MRRLILLAQIIPDLSAQVLKTYPMTAAKRGICLIINNYDFTHSEKGLQKREGTMVDEGTFSDWGMHVCMRAVCENVIKYIYLSKFKSKTS